MRSNEIARIAGVSVRTLRHYHQIGLLEEPPRQPNGYRSYDVQHLIRLLRVGQLAKLGMRLTDIPAVLNRDGEIETSTLDDLDRTLAYQIAVLERQRQTIASLRERQATLDIPQEMAAALIALEDGRDEKAAKAGREQAVLFGHVFEDAEQNEISRLYDRLATTELSGIARELGQRFDALGPDSTDEEIADLANSYVERLGPWLKDFEKIIRGAARPDAGALISEHAVVASNSRQRQMMALVAKALDHAPASKKEGD
ncbi:MerR family transcriptional regulator [Shinella sumterensis]|uniref:MerR family transcriptional regulator n=1 Tax=Shinella sumterensis TaxID=1967501 RepID=UPI003F8267C7